MFESVKAEWRRRPWWMNLIWFFCLYMTFIYMPFDIFTKPMERWEEVWFGFTLHGWAAKATEPVHWLIYGAGAYGFWKMKSWMWPWAAVYSAQVVIAMVVFSLLRGAEAEDRGITGALISGGLFMLPTIALWRAKSKFQPAQTDEVAATEAAEDTGDKT